jgi:putative ABC transport system permease protein
MIDDVRWRRYWRYLTRAFRREVREEMDFHLLQRARDLEALGLSPEDARQEALRRFGDRARIQARLERIERSRGRRITFGYVTEELVQDVRYGVRTLLKRPGFTITTATSLALGIAAITVVLSLVDSWLLRPLPVRHARELVVIGASSQALGPIPTGLISLPTARDIAARTDLFQDAAAVRIAVVAARRPESDQGQRRMLLAAGGSYFSVLGVAPFRGRLFSAEDDRRRERVIVLSHNTWEAWYGADPGAIGATLYLNTVPFEIIGITPRGFQGTEHFFESFGFVPAGVLATLEPSLAGIDDQREGGSFKMIARRQPHATIGAIQAGLDVLTGQLTAAFPDLEEGYRLRAFPESRARPSLEAGVGTVSGAIIFSALALLVLVTAVVNATNLVLVRGSARQSELAVRQALGASRGRVVRQLVTETMLLAFAALAGGWFLARSAVGALTSIPITAADLPMQWNVAVDWRVFGLAVVITVVVGLLAGVGPAFAVSRFDLQHRLREGGRAGMGRRGQRIRSTLVVLQVSASMVVLLIVALLGASVRNAALIDLGFQSDHLVTFGLDAHLAHYDDTRTRLAYERIERRMQEQPGVVATAWANSVAMSPGAMVAGAFEVEAEGTTQTIERGTLSMFYSGVSPAWFQVVRMPVLEGRAFLTTDDSLSAPVAIVNQEAAKTLWPGRSAVGRIIRLQRGGRPVEVVGVVKTSRYLLIGEAPRPFIYVPMAQQPARVGYLYIRTEHDPEQLLPFIPGLVAGVDRDLVPFGMNTMERAIDQSLNGMLLLRLGAGMASGLGALALMLTCVGLYGVVAYSVAQRSREIGLRMALGADRWDVIRSVVAGGGMLAFVGIAVGTVLALLVTRPLSGLLVGVRVTDPVIFTGVAAGLALVTLASAWIPARRAARIDPVRALKEDGLGG